MIKFVPCCSKPIHNIEEESCVNPLNASVLGVNLFNARERSVHLCVIVHVKRVNHI